MVSVRKALLLVLVNGLASSSLIGGSVIDVSGPASGFTQISNVPSAVSWTSTVAYGDVSISAMLTDGGVSLGPISGSAYLTTTFGSGTTVADQVASSNFTYSAPLVDQPVLVPLFSGLSLPAGTYYLALADFDAEAGWEQNANGFSSTVVLGNGVTGPDNWDVQAGGLVSYPPADEWQIFNADGNFYFDVESVPEPSSPALLVLGLGFIVFLIRQRVGNC